MLQSLAKSIAARALLPLVRPLAAAGLLAGLLLAGGPAAGQGAPEYRLGPGDRLGINVFNNPDLTGEFQIDGQGRISIPLLGQVQAANMTITELQELLIQKFNDFIVDPRVSVEVLNYRPFYIYGQVNKPGSYPYVSGVTARQAVAIAGGFTRRADEDTVLVIRYDQDGRRVEVESPLDAPILPGDTIEVERRLF